MKKNLFPLIVLFLIVALLLAVAGCAPSTPPAQKPADDTAKEEPLKIELKLAHFWPAAHPAEKELAQGWADAIYEATDGQITVTTYPGETLLKAAEIYDGVVTGIADVGISCFAYTRGRFPLSEVFELPGIVYSNSKVASKVAWEGLKELNPAEISDTEMMMVLTTGPGDLITKAPIRRLEDLQGLEIRATGLSAKTLEALGAIPVAMPQSDAYESLAKGVVKGNLSVIEVLEGWRQAEVVEYVTFTPFLYNTLFYMTMSKDVWNSLPPDLQEIIRDVNEKFHEEVAIGLWDKQVESALKFAEEFNLELINLSDEEMAKWMVLIEPIQEDFVAEMEAKGLPGREALEVAKRLADKYNEVYK